MSRPNSLKVNEQGIPESLKSIPRWVLWGYVQKGEKWTKVPFQLNGRAASSTDPATWSSYDDTIRAYKELSGFAGVGFVFNGDTVTGGDIDKCITSSGELNPVAQDALSSIGGYWEKSPSGTGLHFITRTELERSYVKPGLELYPTGRFFTITGHQFNGHSTVPDAPEDIAPFIARHFVKSDRERQVSAGNPLDEKPILQRTPEQIRATLFKLDPDMPEPEWLRVCWGLRHQTRGEGLELFLEWSALGAKFDADAARDRWGRGDDSKGNACTWLTVEHMASEVREPIRPHPDATDEDKVPFVEGLQFAAGFEDVEWLIDDVLPRAKVGVIYGASGSGKTFFALDMACHVHAGLPWRDCFTEKADVFYIAAEAGRGIKKRIAAWSSAHPEQSNLPWFVDYQPDLAQLESVRDIRDSIKKRCPSAGLIFVDTLALSHSGDENSTKDMSLMLRNCQTLAEETGAVVILVHHTGKDETKGMRGSSAVYAGADFVYEITSAGKEHGMQIDKQKDGERGRKFGFTLRSVNVGTTPRGKVITSCYIEPALFSTKRKELTIEAQIFIMDVFLEAIGMETSMTETELVEAVREQQRKNDHVPSQAHNIKKSIGRMVNSGHFCKDGERLSLP
jgi:hypothetical protein